MHVFPADDSHTPVVIVQDSYANKALVKLDGLAVAQQRHDIPVRVSVRHGRCDRVRGLDCPEKLKWSCIVYEGCHLSGMR